MNLDTEPVPSEALLSNVSPSSQTLVRGLDVLEQVAEGPAALSVIARQLGLSRSTVHRLATTLLERRYLNVTPRRGYSLGPKLLELGVLARDQISLVRLARPYLDALAAQTGDVALLAVRLGDDVVVADRAAGRRRVQPSLRTGDRLALSGSALGRALAAGAGDAGADGVVADAGVTGVVADAGDLAPEIHTIAAPVRDADGTVRAALGVAAASVYADSAQRSAAAAAVAEAARAMSAELGWHVSEPPATARGAAAQQLRDHGAAAPGAGAEPDAEGNVMHSLATKERDRMGGPSS
jgi:DNA-binding IclR family transcriptional regulator